MPNFYGSLDTNVLLRLLLDDIKDQHQAALALFTQAKGQFAVADTLFIEIAFVLERNYKFTRSQISEAIEGIVSLAKINCNRALLEAALPIFRQHQSLSFEDCCLASYAKLNNAEPLWTFDKKLSSQASNSKLIKAA